MQPRRTRKDRLTVSVIPEPSLDPIFQCPHLPLLFQDGWESDGYSDIKCDSCLADLDDTDEMKTHDAVMREVTDWLELNQRDSEQGSRRSRLRKSVSSIHHSSASYIGRSTSYATEEGSSDALVQFIALQILASCYTILPGVSADGRPFYGSNTGATIGTALRLHSRNRFFPAAGHHARASSETSSWPGLYSGLSIEERIAVKVSEARRLRKAPVQEVPPSPAPSIYDSDSAGTSTSQTERLNHFERVSQGSSWSDGPSPEQRDDDMMSSHTSFAPSSKAQKGLLNRFICPPLKGSQRKLRKRSLGVNAPAMHIPQRLQQPPSKPAKTSPLRTSPVKTILSRTLALWPRRTQSDPRKPSGPESPEDTRTIYRRESTSTPTFPTPFTHTWQDQIQIPEIRRISATTVDEASLSHSDLNAAFASVNRSEESTLTPWSSWSARRRNFHPSSPIISPLGTVKSLPTPRGKRSDYFGYCALETLEDAPGEEYDGDVPTQRPSPECLDDDDDDDCDSVDSNMLDKRKSHYFSAKDFAAPEHSQTPPPRLSSRGSFEDTACIIARRSRTY